MYQQVIPFLPFEQVHIAQIITLKLSQLDENYRGIYWHRLWIEVRSGTWYILHKESVNTFPDRLLL